MRFSLAPLLGLALLSSAAHAQNLITNGDFETGNLSGWSSTNTPNVTTWNTGVPFGTVAEIGVGNAVATLFQSFTLASPTALNLSFAYGTYNAPGGSPVSGPWLLDVTLRNSGASTVWSTTVDAFNASQSGTYRTELSFNGASGLLATDTYTLTFAPRSHGWTTVDNISVTASSAPEPTTLALLGLGLAALRRRRR